MERSLISVEAVYILEFDTNNFAALHCPDPAERERLTFDGTPLGESWRPPRTVWDTAEGTRPIGDFTEAWFVPALSPRAIDALGDLIDAHGEYVPLEIDGGPGDYLALNVTRITDAFDEARSEIAYFSSGRVMGIDRYEFDPHRLAGETIFRVGPFRRDLCVTDAFRRRVEEAGLTGFLWDRLVWSADPAVLERFEEERRRRIEAERAGDQEGFYTHIVPTEDEIGPPDEVIAHRIIPVLKTDNEDLLRAQAKAHRLGIGPDEAVNGAWLPRERSATAYTPSYLRELRQRLWPAEDREQGVRVLREIAAELERGEFPHKGKDPGADS